MIKYGLQIFFSYVVISEEYITIRKPGSKTFLKCYEIPYNQISKVEIKEELHKQYTIRELLIDTTSYGLFRLNTGDVLNFNDIKEFILTRIK